MHVAAVLVSRCQCSGCILMSNGRESVCCCEIEQVVDKKSEHEGHIQCIVDHEGFLAVCLNLWVLQTAYHQYRQ